MKGYWLILGTEVADAAAQQDYGRLWAPIAERYGARLIREGEVATGAEPCLIIMLTANAMDEHVEAARLAGADLHVAKPLHPAQLFAALPMARQSQTSVSAAA